MPTLISHYPCPRCGVGELAHLMDADGFQCRECGLRVTGEAMRYYGPHLQSQAQAREYQEHQRRQQMQRIQQQQEMMMMQQRHYQMEYEDITEDMFGLRRFDATVAPPKPAEPENELADLIF